MTPKRKARPTFYLIDASSLIFRAFFAIRNLSTSKGLPTNATYGFLTMLLGAIEKHKPDYVACIFDTPKPTFRKDMYAEYKANRGAPPDELVPQFDYIHRLVQVLGIQKLAEPGFEADDLIATLAEKFKDTDVVIVTGDKDLMQLVDERVSVLDTMKDKLYGPAEVKEKLGVDPEHVTDYLGLIGDTSDNIPGIPGVGPKTAVELIKEYGNLEKVLAATVRMKPGRRRDLLIEHADKARLSKELATVKRDVGGCCSGLALENFKTPAAHTPEFIEFLNELEFRGLAKKYSASVGAVGATEPAAGATASTQTSVGQPEIVLVANERDWKRCLEKLQTHPVIAFDTETRGGRTTEVEMVGMSLCGDGQETFYVPVRHQGEGTSDQLAPKQALEGFLKLVEGKTVVAQNFKYDYKVLLAEQMPLRGDFSSERFFDTMLAHYLVEPEEKHGLDALAAAYLGAAVGDFKEVLGERPDFSLVPLGDAARYGGLDAWATRNLYDPLKKELKECSLEKLFYGIEMPTAKVLAHLEWNGIAVDPDVLGKLSEEYAVELKEIEKEIFDTVGHTFNLNSPKQLSEVLFTKLGLPVIQKTKTGFSTDVTVLERLAHMHPVPAQIVRYRELNKLKSTYVDVIPSLIEKDGRVHANFNQAVTATGRLSSSDPNLQNIPIKSESGKRIRRAFVAARGAKLVGADYSQIELRLVAHLSGDEALIEAFREKKDVHRATAAEIFRIAPDQVTERQRSAAKAINFGLIYGKTAFGLAQELNISRTEAQAYIEAYFLRYKGVKAFMERCLTEAREKRMATTLFGRRRPIKDIDNRNVGVRNNAERMAMNTPVQGTAADIMKLAMVKAHESCERLGAKLVLQVHDELVLDVPEAKSKEALECLTQDMEHVADLSVPLETSGGIAKHWMDL
ncbi:MAG: DNA polymerase I [Bdellovibrionota bacterium]